MEVTDEEGMKSSIEKEGDLHIEMLRLLTIRDVTKFLELQLSPLPIRNAYDRDVEDLTIKERLASFLRFDEQAPKGWFTSSQIRRIYEEVFDETLSMSTVSTYLANMHSSGILERKGSRAMRQYRSVATESENTEAAGVEEYGVKMRAVSDSFSRS